MKTARFRFFLFLSGLLFLINLLLMNELTTIWNGQEAALFWDAFRPAGSHYFPAWVVGLFSLSPGTFTFWPRTLGGILFLLSLVTFWQVGKKILGLENAV